MKRFLSSVLAASLLASAAPAFAATPELPTELPCQGTADRARARCITDALKSWKAIEEAYDDAEDELVAEWKAEHASMGVGPEYQTALRKFLSDAHARRKEFAKQLNEFRKAFFAEQKTKREEGDGRKATETKLDKKTLDSANSACGVPDDDGAYRICMRIQLRKKAANVDKRSRTNSSVIRQN